jgi:hypothetical protein
MGMLHEIIGGTMTDKCNFFNDLPAASRSPRKQLQHPLPTSAHQAIDPHLSPYEQLLLMDEANKEMLHLNRIPILASLTDKHPNSQ